MLLESRVDGLLLDVMWVLLLCEVVVVGIWESTITVALCKRRRSLQGRLSIYIRLAVEVDRCVGCRDMRSRLRPAWHIVGGDGT